MSMLDIKHATGQATIVNYNEAGEVVPPWPSLLQLRKLPRELQERILLDVEAQKRRSLECRLGRW